MLHDSLLPTMALLQRAFPEGIDESEYLPTLSALYPHMADENLAIVISEYTGRDLGIVRNDVLRAGSGATGPADVEARVRKKLLEAGVEQWAHEDEP